MKFLLYGEIIEFNDDLKSYQEYRESFFSKKVLLLDKLSKLFQDRNNIESIITVINDTVEESIKSFITELSENDIYNFTIDDFLNENQGYLHIIQLEKAYLDTIFEMAKKSYDVKKDALSRAQQNANKQITGLDFGIISNSLIAHMMYASKSEKEIKKQMYEAELQYSKAAEQINREVVSARDKAIDDVFFNQFIPNIKEYISEFYDGLFNQQVNIIPRINKIHSNCVSQLDYKRSESLLENLDLVNDKEKLLFQVVQTCPYNLDLYLNAFKYGLFSNELIEIIKYLNIEEDLIAIFEQSEYIISYNPSQGVRNYIRNNESIFSLFEKFTCHNKEYFIRLYLEPILDTFLEKLEKLISFFESTDGAKFNILFSKYGETDLKIIKVKIKLGILDYFRVKEDDLNCLNTYCRYNELYSEISKICKVNITEWRSLMNFLEIKINEMSEDYAKKLNEIRAFVYG